MFLVPLIKALRDVVRSHFKGSCARRNAGIDILNYMARSAGAGYVLQQYLSGPCAAPLLYHHEVVP